MAKLEVEYSSLSRETDKLIQLLNNINSLQPKYAKLVAEILLLRLFDSLWDTIISVTSKIMCGALYADGSRPGLYIQSKSKRDSINNMIYYGRKKPIYLRWSGISDIRNNIRFTVHPNEHFISELDRHSFLLEEIRWIRNRIAHNNTNARNKYKKVVLRCYGAYVNSVTPGTLLLTPRKSPVLLEQYLKQARILIKDVIKG